MCVCVCVCFVREYWADIYSRVRVRVRDRVRVSDRCVH